MSITGGNSTVDDWMGQGDIDPDRIGATGGDPDFTGITGGDWNSTNIIRWEGKR